MTEYIVGLANKQPSTKADRYRKLLPSTVRLVPLYVDHREEDHVACVPPFSYAKEVAKHKHNGAKERIDTGRLRDFLQKELGGAEKFFLENVVMVTHDVHVVIPDGNGGKFLGKPSSLATWMGEIDTLSHTPWAIVGSIRRSFPFCPEIPEGSFDYKVEATTGAIGQLVRQKMKEDASFSDRVMRTSSGINFSWGAPWFTGPYTVYMRDANEKEAIVVNEGIVEEATHQDLERALFGGVRELWEGLFDPKKGIHDKEIVPYR